jgi:hypothetical protein
MHLGHPALACTAGSGGFYPVCDVPAPNADEQVIIVKSFSEHTRTNLVLGVQKESPFLVDIVVTKSTRPLYVFLDDSQSPGTVFRFSGSTDAVSRAVLFRDTIGRENGGYKPRLLGLIGLPREKIIYAPITGFDKTYRTSCGSGPKGCRIEQSFSNVDQDRTTAEGFGDSRRHTATFKADHVLTVTRTGRVHIPPDSSQLDIHDVGQAEHKLAMQKWRDDEQRRVNMSAAELERYFHPGGVTKIRPSDVVGPPGLQIAVATQLADLAGAALLESQGLLFRPGTPRFQEIYDRWDAVVSAPHTNRFQPGLRLSLPVDYVVTGAVELPRFKNKVISGGELNAFYTVVLVAEGVPAPVVPEASKRNTCIVYADGRMEKPCHQVDPRYSLASWEAEVRPPTPQSSCQVVQSPIEGSAISAWVFAGREPDDAGRINMSAIMSDDLFSATPGRVDMRIKRPGKFFLYLQNERYVDWHISTEPHSEVSGAMLVSSLGTKVSGLAPGTPVYYVNPKLIYDRYCQKLVQNMRSTNPSLPPNANDLLRGFRALAGRDFDLFLSKQFPGHLSKSILADPVRLKEYTSYVVE